MTIKTTQIFDSPVQISLIDLTGSVVATFEGSKYRIAEGSYELNVQHLPAGLWLLQLDDGNHSATRRLVIAK